MKVFVTGVNGQLGHDIMDELGRTGHEGVGSDQSRGCAGIAGNPAAAAAPYVQLDITDQ